MGADTLEEIVRTFQVVFPDEEADSWTSSEDRPTGQYLARYRRRADGSLDKRKLSYTLVDVPFGAGFATVGPEARLSESTTLVRFAPARIHEGLDQVAKWPRNRELDSICIYAVPGSVLPRGAGIDGLT